MQQKPWHHWQNRRARNDQQRMQQSFTGKGGERSMANRKTMKTNAMLVSTVAWETSMLLSKGLLPMDVYAASVNKNFIFFVCIGFKITVIARVVTRKMWCHSVTPGSSFRICFKEKRRQGHNPSVHTPKVISLNMSTITWKLLVWQWPWSSIIGGVTEKSYELWR